MRVESFLASEQSFPKARPAICGCGLSYQSRDGGPTLGGSHRALNSVVI
jgi:hypothetical protein